MPNFEQLLQRLTEAGVDFVIVGGYAAISHGSSYLTRDVDVCMALTDETVANLRRALADWNPRHRFTTAKLPFLDFPPAGQPLKNLYLETDKGVLDIISEVLGIGDFERIREKAEELEVDGMTVRVISLPDLIAAKEAMGREKDLLTAKELRAILAKRQQG